MKTFQPIDTSTYAAVLAPASFGPAPDQRWIKIEQLVVDPAYQRPVSAGGRKTVRKIAENFDWRFFSPVTVSPVEGGIFAIVDGQHRTTAAALLGIEQVPCAVIQADRAAQAKAFTAINGTQTKVSPVARFNARVTAGDEVAGPLAACLARRGIRLRAHQDASTMSPGDTNATVTCEKIWRERGAHLADVVFTHARTAAGDLPGMLNGMVLMAFANVLADHAEWRSRLDIAETVPVDQALLDARRASLTQKGVRAQDHFEARLVEHYARRAR